MPRVKLTQDLVATASCPPSLSRQDLFDLELPGFCLEVRVSGGKTFYVRYRSRTGQQRQYRLGSASVLDLATARREARRLLAEASLGGDPVADKRNDRQIRTFRAFIEESYLPYARTYKASVKTEKSLLRNHLLPRFGRRPMDTITRHDIVSLQQARRNAGAAVASANRLVVMMKYIFNLAIKWEEPGVGQNPAHGVRLFTVNNQREHYITPAQIQALFRAVEKSSNPQLIYIIPMLVLTGARKREVLTARWGDLDLGRRLWRIPITKSGKARHVPLSDSVLALLAQVPRLDDCPFVFGNPETRRPFADIFFPWNKARQAAGLPDLRIHDLRHTYASLLVNAGRTLYEVQKLLGHSQIRTTQRYAHLAPETLLDATNSAGKAIDLRRICPPEETLKSLKAGPLDLEEVTGGG